MTPELQRTGCDLIHTGLAGCDPSEKVWILMGISSLLVFFFEFLRRWFGFGVREQQPVVSPPPRTSLAPSDEQLAFVQSRIEEHQQRFLSYELWQAGTRRDLATPVLRELIGGGEPVLAVPVLLLYSSGILWEPEVLDSAVNTVLARLSLPASAELINPANRASEACRIWAEQEAVTRVETWSADHPAVADSP